MIESGLTTGSTMLKMAQPRAPWRVLKQLNGLPCASRPRGFGLSFWLSKKPTTNNTWSNQVVWCMLVNLNLLGIRTHPFAYLSSSPTTTCAKKLLVENNVTRNNHAFTYYWINKIYFLFYYWWFGIKEKNGLYLVEIFLDLASFLTLHLTHPHKIIIPDVKKAVCFKLRKRKYESFVTGVLRSNPVLRSKSELLFSRWMNNDLQETIGQRRDARETREMPCHLRLHDRFG